MVKQVIVIRKDLKMRRGKEIAQGCHASMKVIFDKFINYDNSYVLEEDEDEKPDAWKAWKEWIDGIFTKIVVSVNSENELFEIYDLAKRANLPVSMVTDLGLTEFHGKPTVTALAIGPAYAEEIDPITKNLKLL